MDRGSRELAGGVDAQVRLLRTGRVRRTRVAGSGAIRRVQLLGCRGAHAKSVAVRPRGRLLEPVAEVRKPRPGLADRVVLPRGGRLVAELRPLIYAGALLPPNRAERAARVRFLPRPPRCLVEGIEVQQQKLAVGQPGFTGSDTSEAAPKLSGARRHRVPLTLRIEP